MDSIPVCSGQITIECHSNLGDGYASFILETQMLKFALIAAIVTPFSVLAQSSEEQALVSGIFNQVNPRSIAENVEYCGYIGFTADGELSFSQPTRGDESSCLPDEADTLELLTASYHTHAAHSPDYSSELPSGTDMEGDEDEGIDGWVATPGGRLWYIDTTDMITRQICGIGCLPTDPAFIAGESGVIQQSYSYNELVIKLDE